jgi:hypothetical protein
LNVTRLRTFTEGVAMVVTDLHGEGDAYQRLRDVFLQAHGRGDVQRLVLCGDLLHVRHPDSRDDSLTMLYDVMTLQAEMGADTVLMLCGNHELPHIYGFALTRGHHDYTGGFEHALREAEETGKATYTRAQVSAFLRGLPFYACTGAGVTLSHVGAPPSVDANALARLLAFDHDALLQWAEAKMARYDTAGMYAEANYLRQAWRVLAVRAIDDPRIGDLLRGEILMQTSPDFDFLWQAFFLHNEQERGLPAYLADVEAFLGALNAYDLPTQRYIVSGHVNVMTGRGHVWVGEHQLRLASHAHAHPPQAGEYLLLDCGKRITRPQQLTAGLRRTWG